MTTIDIDSPEASRRESLPLANAIITLINEWQEGGRISSPGATLSALMNVMILIGATELGVSDDEACALLGRWFTHPKFADPLPKHRQ